MTGEEALAAFLAARLDEAGAAACYVGPARIAWLTYRDSAGQLLYTTVAATSGDSEDVWVADGKVLAEPALIRVVYDPARVLREVKAMRAVLERYERGRGGDLPEWKAGRDLIEAGLAVLLGVLRDLAIIWSDHPDYRSEWGP